MSEKDRERWDAKWGSRSGELLEPHPVLTKHREMLASRGDALDLACGRGQNALWLARLGYRVVGVDISRVALKSATTDARRFGLSQQTVFEQTDIDSYSPPVGAYDLVCVIRFLDRRLFSAIRASLRPGGLVVYATRHLGALEAHPGINDAYLLERGELLEQFIEWTVLHYREGPVETEIIARKPADI
ncbi:MAG: class I SAM-dependent methyltransferase [Candidatus Promineifilaceae bacterium]